jgi:lipid A disaccharide synthetase
MNTEQILNILHQADCASSFLQSDSAPQKLEEGGKRFANQTEANREQLKKAARDLQAALRAIQHAM